MEENIKVVNEKELLVTVTKTIDETETINLNELNHLKHDYETELGSIQNRLTNETNIIQKKIDEVNTKLALFEKTEVKDKIQNYIDTLLPVEEQPITEEPPIDNGEITG